jgi:hypothetical protein
MRKGDGAMAHRATGAQGRRRARGVGLPVGVKGGAVLPRGGEDEAVVAVADVRGCDSPQHGGAASRAVL